MPETDYYDDDPVVVHVHNESTPLDRSLARMAKSFARLDASHPQRRYTTDSRAAATPKVYGFCRTPTRVTRDQGPVKRTLIATYPGTSFVAERNEDGSLAVYHVGDENISTSLFGDSGQMTAAKFQAGIEASRATRGQR